jgi:hypothetical protein
MLLSRKQMEEINMAEEKKESQAERPLREGFVPSPPATQPKKKPTPTPPPKKDSK